MKFGELALHKDVSDDEILKLSNGTKIRCLRDLADSLEDIDEGDFKTHVSKMHNDFGEWVNEAYGDLDLAIKIGKTAKPKKMIKLIETALKNSKTGSAHEIVAPKRKRDILNQIKNARN